MSRVWTISVAVECGTCGVTDDKTSVAATSCETAREGALRILRYRGWRIGRKTHDNSCPSCAGPIPGCADCGTPTPDPYGKSDWSERHAVRRCAGATAATASTAPPNGAPIIPTCPCLSG